LRLGHTLPLGHSPHLALSPNRHPESVPTCRRTYSDTF
jgi:hypothetical protein